MLRFFVIIGILVLLVSCSGPSVFNKPADYVGSEARAMDIKCRWRGSTNKDSIAYQMCVQSFRNHYSR